MDQVEEKPGAVEHWTNLHMVQMRNILEQMVETDDEVEKKNEDMEEPESKKRLLNCVNKELVPEDLVTEPVPEGRLVRCRITRNRKGVKGRKVVLLG